MQHEFKAFFGIRRVKGLVGATSFHHTFLLCLAAVILTAEASYEIRRAAVSRISDPALLAGIEHQLPVVGDSYDQSYLSPEYVLTSAQYNVDKLMEKAYNDIIGGTFSGSIVEGGMADGVVALVYGDGAFNPSVPEDLQAQLNDVIAKITGGEMEIVGNPNDLQQ